MKKHLSLALNLLLLFSITSCSNKTESSKSTPIAEFRHGLIQLNESDQKAIFDGLPAQVKVELWKDRLNESMKSSLTDKQKELLKQLSDHLSVSIYDSVAGNDFRSFALGWYEKARNEFKNDDSTKLTDACMRLGPGNNNPPILQQGLQACDCDPTNNFHTCSLFANCLARSVCKANRCGFFWAYYCSEMCG